MGELRTREITDDDWQNKWKDYFFPIPVGQKILICPSWRVVENNRAVLDFGSGSGILSIAATKLGAKKCVGIEIEPNAIKSANENLVKNNVQENVMLINDEFNQSLIPNIKFNLVIANISTKIILETFEKLDFNLHETGNMILSGILKDSLHKVENLIEIFNYKIDELLTDNDWIALQISRK